MLPAVLSTVLLPPEEYDTHVTTVTMMWREFMFAKSVGASLKYGKREGNFIPLNLFLSSAVVCRVKHQHCTGTSGDSECNFVGADLRMSGARGACTIHNEAKEGRTIRHLWHPLPSIENSPRRYNLGTRKVKVVFPTHYDEVLLAENTKEGAKVEQPGWTGFGVVEDGSREMRSRKSSGWLSCRGEALRRP